jgi:uncharacterized protein (DUF305 family)
MNKKEIIVALVIGLIIGHVTTFAYRSGNDYQGAHRMPDGEVMHGSMMQHEMGGMMTGLAGKTGDEFDKAFLTEMIVHHEGAVDMAEAALANAKHQELKTMANAIISAQTSEINQMKAWLESWY